MKIGLYAKTYWAPALLDKPEYISISGPGDLSDFDIVVLSLPKPSVDTSIDFLSKETIFLYRLAASAYASGIRPILISSGEVFPSKPPDREWTVKDVPLPSDHYGMTELIAEYGVRQFGGRVIRTGKVYGLHIPTAPWLMLEESKPERFFSTAETSWTYIDDLSSAIMREDEEDVTHICHSKIISPRDICDYFGTLVKTVPKGWIGGHKTPLLVPTREDDILQWRLEDLYGLSQSNKGTRFMEMQSVRLWQ